MVILSPGQQQILFDILAGKGEARRIRNFTFKVETPMACELRREHNEERARQSIQWPAKGWRL